MKLSTFCLVPVVLVVCPGLFEHRGVYADEMGDSFLCMREMIGRGEYDSAIVKLESLIRRYPRYLPLYESLAEVCLYDSSTERGVEILKDRFHYGQEIGSVYYGLGMLFKVRKSYSQALEYFRKSIHEGLDVPEVYSSLSECYCRTHRVDEAVRYFTAVCHRQPDNPNAWYALALVYWEARSYENIDRCISRAIAGAPRCSSYLQAKISCLVLLRRFHEAVVLAKSILSNGTGGANPSSFVRTSHSVAYSLIQLREFARADTVLSLGIAAASKYGYRSSFGWLSVLRANLCFLTGRFVESLQLARTARTQAELVGDSVLSVESYIWEHQGLTDMGLHDDGIVAACRAGIESVARSDEMLSMLSLVALSVSTQELGMDSLSLELAIESMTRMEQYAPDPYTRLLVQARLSEAYLMVGNLRAAIDVLPNLNTSVSSHIRSSIVVAIAHGVLGYAMLHKRELASATQHFRMQLSLARAQRFRREECAALAGLASVALERGSLRKARRLLYDGLLIRESNWPVQLRVRILGNLAETFIRSGEKDSADLWLQKASTECWELLPKLDFDYRRNGLWSFFRCLVRKHVQVLVDLGRIDDAFVVSQRLTWVPVQEAIGGDFWRSLSLSPGEGLARKLGGIGKLVSARSVGKYSESHMKSWVGSESDITKAFCGIMAEAELRKSIAAEKLWSFESWNGSTEGAMKEDGRVLYPGERDLAIVRFIVGELRTDVLVAFDGAIRNVKIGMGESPLRSALSKITNIVQQAELPEYAVNRYSMDFDVGASEQAAKTLVVPWLQHVRNAKRLALLLDGCLQAFPFEMFLLPPTQRTGSTTSGKPVYMVERFAIQYVTNYSEALNLQISPSGGAPHLLIVAGSSLGRWERQRSAGVDSVLGYGGGSSVRHVLRGLSDEAAGIQALFGSSVELLSGDRATIGNFMNSSPNPEIVHIALHSVFDGPSGLCSAAFFAPEGEDDSGLFYAYRLFPMHLNARLIVLSGCNTAGVFGGEGRGFGFAGVLHSKGVGSIVGSLWPVDDDATAYLMAEFYRQLRRGASVSEALQSAKCEMIESGKRNPYLWAGFVLVGRDSEFRGLEAVEDNTRSGMFNWLWLDLFSCGCVGIGVLLLVLAIRSK